MTRTELLSFLRAQPWTVQASVSGEYAPQAAVVGVAVTDALELVFDTLDGPARLAWPGLTYFRVRPTWIRYTDFRGERPVETIFGAEVSGHLLGVGA